MLRRPTAAAPLLVALLFSSASLADTSRPSPRGTTSAVAPAAASSALEPPEDAPPISEKARKILELPWQNGPVNGSLGTKAQITVPAGQMFLDGDATRRFLELNHNPTNGSELGLVAAEDLEWVVTFEFSDIGHVKDDDKASLDADAILADMRKGNAEGNKTRTSRGWDSVSLTGWATPPRYDAATHNLEWATNIQNDTTRNVTVNHSIRLLGREGVMEALLLVPPEQYPVALPACKTMLGGFAYLPGHRYAEFREGDRIAEIGLTGLITGGALAVAAKSGLLGKAGKGIIKLLVVIGVACAAVIGKLFGKKNSDAA
jgi:uncharacterized membrane-anchored protein